MLLLKRSHEQSLGKGTRVCVGGGRSSLVGSNPKVRKENRQNRFEFQIAGIMWTELQPYVTGRGKSSESR